MKLKINHIASRLIIAIIAFAMLASCSGVKKLQQMEVKSYKIESIVPHGFRSIDGTIAITVNNPGSRISMTECSGTVYDGDKALVDFTIEDFTINGKCEGKYPITVNAELGRGISLFSLKSLISSNFDNYTVDIHGKAKIKGLGTKKVDLKNVPARALARYFGIRR